MTARWTLANAGLWSVSGLRAPPALPSELHIEIVNAGFWAINPFARSCRSMAKYVRDHKSALACLDLQCVDIMNLHSERMPNGILHGETTLDRGSLYLGDVGILTCVVTYNVGDIMRVALYSDRGIPRGCYHDARILRHALIEFETHDRQFVNANVKVTGPFEITATFRPGETPTVCTTVDSIEHATQLPMELTAPVTIDSIEADTPRIMKCISTVFPQFVPGVVEDAYVWEDIMRGWMDDCELAQYEMDDREWTDDDLSSS